jgi:hypothetical protein
MDNYQLAMNNNQLTIACLVILSKAKNLNTAELVLDASQCSV